MNVLFFLALVLEFSLFSSVRNIFLYDNEWEHVDYIISAQGSFYKTGTSFKVISYNGESKIISTS